MYVQYAECAGCLVVTAVQGLYISVPFCRSKCSFCNFASGVFPPERLGSYVAQLAADIRGAKSIAASVGGRFERLIDSVYFGGGTPSLLSPEHVHSVFDAIHGSFSIAPEPEITMECAPNSISDETLASMLSCGVNRISFGAQSFVDSETRSVARLHSAADTVRDVQRIRAAGIENISIDLIAGLPHQTMQSWEYSLDRLIDLGVPHVSVYMLEVDEDSRLGREVMAGGTRYHAHTVPDEETVVAMYEHAVEKLDTAGIRQYEISNFAREGHESKHNLKYWKRDPYFGFGADAHSMLHSVDAEFSDVRFATTEELVDFEAAPDHYTAPVQRLTKREALEEAVILGLRLNQGVDCSELARRYHEDPREVFAPVLRELSAAELLELGELRWRLTPRGRLLSNEVFERLLGSSQWAGAAPAQIRC